MNRTGEYSVLPGGETVKDVIGEGGLSNSDMVSDEFWEEWATLCIEKFFKKAIDQDLVSDLLEVLTLIDAGECYPSGLESLSRALELMIGYEGLSADVSLFFNINECYSHSSQPLRFLDNDLADTFGRILFILKPVITFTKLLPKLA